MLCGIIAKTAKGWIICLNVKVCYKLITLLVFVHYLLNRDYLPVISDRYKYTAH